MPVPVCLDGFVQHKNISFPSIGIGMANVELFEFRIVTRFGVAVSCYIMNSTIINTFECFFCFCAITIPHTCTYERHDVINIIIVVTITDLTARANE